MRPAKLTYGAGVLDVPGACSRGAGGSHSRNPFYVKWSDMLMRCYSAKYQIKYPTYIGCTVCPEWLVFSNFQEWMQSKQWEGLELDKDIIIPGNKEYSPEACAFIPEWLNKFFSRPARDRDGLPTGVSLIRAAPINKYLAYMNADGEQYHLGRYPTPEEAKRAYDAEKTRQAYMRIGRYSLTQSRDDRVIKALLARAETGRIL